MQKIVSKENPKLVQAGKLMRSAKFRLMQRQFIAEGLRLCRELMIHHIPIHRLIVTERFCQEHGDFVDELEKVSGDSVTIPDYLGERLANTVHAQGIFCICPMLDNTPNAVKICKGSLYLVLCNLQDPGNMGTVIRTAAALGVDGVFVSEDSVDLYNPKVLRASMGGLFQTPTAVVAHIPSLIAGLRLAQVSCFAAALDDQSVPVGRMDFTDGGALFIGNEGRGLPPGIRDSCDMGVQIPIVPGSESLNAGIATGILLWEMGRHAGKLRHGR